MFDNMLALNEAMVALHSVSGQIPERGRPRNLWPRGAYETRDGYIALNVPDNIIWSRLCKAMGREDLIEDARANSGTARSANAEALQPILEGWLAGLGRDQAVDTLNAVGVPCGPVYTAVDVFADEHVAARGMIMPIEDPEFGGFAFARTTPHLSAAPELPKAPAPNLGQHTREVLEDLLGYAPAEVDRLAAAGAVETDEA
jgi:crotonobetainyl-CoA:carnitine CoA-transferase CaiB-like acyl-CoA transferase